MQEIETNKSPNHFVRSLVVLLCILLAGMLVYNFFLTEPLGEINTGLISLIGILVVIVLSESFDRFSIGKILAISRENEKKETEINRLTGENDELRKQIINVVTSVSQNQSNMNFIGAHGYGMIPTVQSASDEEIQEKDSEEGSVEDQNRGVRRRPDFRKIEEVALNKFLFDRNLEKFSLIKDAKLVTQFHGIDSVSNIQPIFDGYINTGEEEVFIEVRPSFTHATMWRERVYMMLNKIHLYRSIKKSNAHLDLILVTIPEEVTDRQTRTSPEKIEEFFEPAIANGFLRITHLELTSDEAESCMREVR